MMKLKKSMILLILAVFLISMSYACASDANDTAVANDDATPIESAQNNDIDSTDEAQTIGQTDENNTEVLGDGQGTFSGLAEEIGNGGNIELQHDYYKYDKGNPIHVTVDNTVIDGKGALIDMNGKNVIPLGIYAKNITIKNLSITKIRWLDTSDNNRYGGAIYFGPYSSGTIENCTFFDTHASGGGALFFGDHSNFTVINCTFIKNQALFNNGGAIVFNDDSTCSVINCTFINNTAYSWGGAICFNRNNRGSVTNCYFENNTAEKGGAVLCWNWHDITLDSCILKTGSDTTFNTLNLAPILNVNNFTTVYNSGEKIVLDLKTNSGMPIINENITVSVYHKNNDSWVGNYSFLSGEEWTIDLPLGIYYAIFNTRYAGFEANRTIAVVQNSIIIVENTTLDLKVDDEFSLNAAADPDSLAITYVSSDESVAIVDNNGIVTAVGEGTATITASVGDDIIYKANSITVTVNVSRIATEIILVNDTLDLKVNDLIENAAILNPAGASGLTFVSSNESVVKIFDDTLFPWDDGTATVTVSFAGNYKYAAAENRTITVRVSHHDASVSVEQDTMNCEPGHTYLIKATTNPEGLKIEYVSSDDSVVTVNERGLLTAVSTGTVIITLSVGGDTNYAYNSTNITVNVRIPTEITLNNETLNLNVNEFVGDFAYLTPAEAGELTVVSNNTDVVKIIDGKIYAWGEGNATVTVSFADNGIYAAAESKNITVISRLNGAVVRVENTTVNITNSGRAYFLNATTLPEPNLKIEYVSSNSSIATVNETGHVKGVAPGTAIITLTICRGDIHYAEYSLNVTVNVRIFTSIDFNRTLDMNANTSVNAGDVASIGPADAGELTFTSSDESVVVIENGMIKAVGAGKANITVSFAGDDIYAPARNRTIQVTVTANDAKVNVIKTSYELRVGESDTIVASTVPDGLKVEFRTDDDNIISVDDNGKITALGVGNATIFVSVGDNRVYKYDVVLVNVSVDKMPTQIVSSSVSTVYNMATDMTIILKDINGNPIGNTNVTVDLNGTKSYTTDANGTIKVPIDVSSIGTYTVNITFAGNEKYNQSNATASVEVAKDSSKLTANAVTTTYKANKNLVITLTDSQGNALSGFNIKVDLNGAKTYTTNNKGQVTINLANLVPKTYTAKITFNGNDNYLNSAKSVKVTVKKAKATITAKKKTFKKSLKVKKYAIALKSGKTPIKKAKVTIKIGKKIFKATTNAKGKATFKIKKLTKKGTYKATVAFKGNKYYNKVTKKAKIKVR